VSRAPAGSFAALGLRTYRTLWLAEFAGDLGNWMQTIGAQWIVVRHADAVLLAGLIVAASRTPMLAVAAPIGALADRVDRRRLLLASQLFEGTVAATLAVLSGLGHVGPAVLLTCTALLGGGSAVSIIAFQSIVPDVVPAGLLPSAVAMAQVNLNIARVVGPPIGGLLVGLLGPTSVFVVDACSYFVFVAVLLSVDLPSAAPRPAAGRLRHSIVEGLTTIRASPILRRALLHTVLTTLPYSAVWALLPSVAVQVLGLGAVGYGELLAAIGVGSIIGVLVFRSGVVWLGPGRLAVTANMAAAVLLSVMIGFGTPTVALGCLLGFGAASLILLTQVGATVQFAAPDGTRARVLSVFTSIRVGGQGVGALCFGLLGQAIGVGNAMLVAGGGFLLAAVVTYWRPPKLDVLAGHQREISHGHGQLGGTTS
jgi:predicted MFS family arabinose efflux permease